MPPFTHCTGRRRLDLALTIAITLAGCLASAAPASASFTQQATLTASDEIGNSLLGSAVALSPDGNLAVVGGPQDDNGIGAVWVFARRGSTWTEQAKLTGRGEIGSGAFGTSVALSSDGKTVLIGAPGDNGGLGAAWVFVRHGPNWVQQERLTGKDAGGAQEEAHCERVEGGSEYCFVGHPAEFGTSVALSSNGNTALIGAPGDNEYDGAVWVFARSGADWRQQGEKLRGGSEEGDFTYYEARHRGYFGTSVALSADGNTTLIGANRDNFGTGAAWVFTRSRSTWSQQGKKLTRPAQDGRCYLGTSVALSADGNTALIGEPGGFHCGPGDAFVLTRANAMWTWQATLRGECFTHRCYYGGFGESVALSSGGSTALIGTQETSCGSERDCPLRFARVFTSLRGVFTQQFPPLECGGGACPRAPRAPFSEGAPSVALSGDASTALVGTAVYVSAPTHK